MPTSETQKPLKKYYGVCEWERSLDPWHADAFPDEFKDHFRKHGSQGERKSGWMGCDWCGNPLIFIPDGTEEADDL